MYDMLTNIQFSFLKTFYHLDTNAPASENRLSLDKIFVDNFPQKVFGKFVVDFGCGLGGDTKTMAEWGAKLSLGLEIREELVKTNSENIKLSNCVFATTLSAEFKQKADLIISIDAFEHFSHPADMLKIMYDCLHPGGEAFISFGPTWYHPFGGHLFAVFPWAHLIFTEKALLRWRNQFYNDGATKFNEVAGGLNQLSIAEFVELFNKSGFVIQDLNCKPIRGQRWLQKILGREFTTSMVLVRLKKP
ncbi:MAG: methyltransferase domain-containing protein [Bacteriovorax sp.]|nr:methyltransferase domain-containing protein [Bacteriovorax sp.]